MSYDGIIVAGDYGGGSGWGERFGGAKVVGFWEVTDEASLTQDGD